MVKRGFINFRKSINLEQNTALCSVQLAPIEFNHVVTLESLISMPTIIEPLKPGARDGVGPDGAQAVE
jgi:hypothetical protein